MPATNTGSKGGVYVQLQQILGYDLLHLGCRHHLLEILLEAVFLSHIPEASQSPDVAAFIHFREFWQFADGRPVQNSKQRAEGGLCEQCPQTLPRLLLKGPPT